METWEEWLYRPRSALCTTTAAVLAVILLSAVVATMYRAFHARIALAR
jgi:hypothetical protein